MSNLARREKDEKASICFSVEADAKFDEAFNGIKAIIQESDED
jgi:hypothetical protein